MLEVPEYEFFWQKMLNSPENKLVPVHYVFMEVYMSNESNVLLRCMGPDSDPQ